jgi:hypothetical protein
MLTDKIDSFHSSLRESVAAYSAISFPSEFNGSSGGLVPSYRRDPRDFGHLFLAYLSAHSNISANTSKTDSRAEYPWLSNGSTT